MEEIMYLKDKQIYECEKLEIEENVSRQENFRV